MKLRGKSHSAVACAALFLLCPALLVAAQKPSAGIQVSDFAFTDFAGREHHLSDFSGRYVLLDFWATWCAPCIKEVPTLKKAYAEYRGRGLEIVGMDSDKKNEKAQHFIEENQIPWLQSAPESTKDFIHQMLKVRLYPAMVLLDPQRKIVLVSGDDQPMLAAEELLKALDRILPAASPAAKSAEKGSN